MWSALDDLDALRDKTKDALQASIQATRSSRAHLRLTNASLDRLVSASEGLFQIEGPLLVRQDDHDHASLSRRSPPTVSGDVSREEVVPVEGPFLVAQKDHASPAFGSPNSASGDISPSEESVQTIGSFIVAQDDQDQDHNHRSPRPPPPLVVSGDVSPFEELVQVK